MEKRDRPFFRKSHRIITLMLVMLASYTNVSAGIALKVNNLLIFAYPEEGYATVSPYKWLSWLESWVDHKDYNQFEDLVIPDSVTWEEHWGEVTKIYTLPVTAIGDNAFEKCDKVKHITLPNTIKTIGRRAFYGCTDLEDINLPMNVEVIRDLAFWGCENLDSFTIGPLVDSIGIKAFDVNYVKSMVVSSANKTFDSRDGGNLIAHTATNTLVWCSPDQEIPKSIEIIGDYAFSGAESLTSIYIPDNVKIIGKYALGFCHNLKNIRLPSQLERIEEGAFDNCIITSITIPETVIYIGSMAFETCQYLANINIPKGIKSIEERTFFDCTYLTECHLPDGLETISDGAFWSCDKLENIAIPNSVRYIGDRAFYDCESLQEIKLPDALEYIGNDVFSCYFYWTVLTTVMMPTSHSGFDAQNTFSGCMNIHSVVCDVEHPTYPLPYNMFLETSSPYSQEHFIYDQAVLYVPTNSIEEYKALDGWREFSDIRPLSSLAGAEEFVNSGSTETTEVFNLQGQRYQSARKGINIIRYKNGITKKVLK